MNIHQLQDLLKEITPGPWKYDMGNWQIEGPMPDRYTICEMSPENRRPSFDGQSLNPVSSFVDGSFIAAAPTFVSLLIAVEKAARAQDLDQLKNGGKYNIPLAHKVHVALRALEDFEMDDL